MSRQTLFFNHYDNIGEKSLRMWAGAVVAGLAAVLIVVVITGLVHLVERTVCANAATIQGIEHQWKLFGGCFYEVNDEWIPADNYRGIVDL